MKVLTREAEDERADFDAHFSNRGCTCFISPPCSFCTHPGNPRNQDEDDSAWEDVKLVCVDNTGVEDRFDIGTEYRVEEGTDGLVNAYDNNGVCSLFFKDRFKLV